jgi:hypothetical protein
VQIDAEKAETVNAQKVINNPEHQKGCQENV